MTQLDSPLYQYSLEKHVAQGQTCTHPGLSLFRVRTATRQRHTKSVRHVICAIVSHGKLRQPASKNCQVLLKCRKCVHRSSANLPYIADICFAQILETPSAVTASTFRLQKLHQTSGQIYCDCCRLGEKASQAFLPHSLSAKVRA